MLSKEGLSGRTCMARRVRRDSLMRIPEPDISGRRERKCLHIHWRLTRWFETQELIALHVHSHVKIQVVRVE
jgi:hypothetical protein